MKHTLKALAAILVLSCAQAAQAVPIAFSVNLSGPNESPSNASPGTGIGGVFFDPDAHTMRVVVDFSGLTGTTTASHIHCCTAIPGVGTAGVATTTPNFTGFPLGVTAGSYDHTFDMTLATSYNMGANQFLAANGNSVAAAEAALLAGSFAGRSYLNIHSTTFGGGEIRGFLVYVPEPVTLSVFGAGVAGVALLRRRRKQKA